jgi:leucyl aminopeptidase
MTDFTSLLIADRGQKARPIHIVDKDHVAAWLKSRPASDRALLAAHRFDGKSASASALLPRGEDFEVVASVAKADALTPWCLAKLAESLPEGHYRLAQGDPGAAALGWLLGQHRFRPYKSKKDDKAVGPRVLLTGEAARIDETVRLADATALVRDLVNTPAADLGPAELEEAVRREAKAFHGEVSVTKGDELAAGFPLVHAVGRAATDARAPRLIEMRWGKPDHPKVAVVGKGVCFDSGGLDLKQPAWMRIMKKDMGGAAHALALARLIALSKLPVRLHLLIPAVENAVSGDAYRPGDIIKSRKGLQVEIDNTDAEGRLILADAIARAGEDEPVLIIDFATLTGAARVALGPELPALFANDDALLGNIEEAGRTVSDQVWRMPLWDGYEDMLKSDVADLVNSTGSAHAGAVTAALFLRRFVPDKTPWAHLDTYAWRDSAKPGCPKGGDALGLRAVFAMLQARFQG